MPKKCKECGQDMPKDKPKKLKGKERFSKKTAGTKCHIWREPK